VRFNPCNKARQKKGKKRRKTNEKGKDEIYTKYKKL
jgi:hypothetical protein